MKTMKHKMNTFMIAIVSLLLMTSCNNDDDHTIKNTNMVDVGGYKLFTESLGQGSHTLVFEAGLGDNYEAWYQLLSLSQSNQVIAYNRGGYVPSEQANNDRDIVQLAEDLHRVILNKSQNDKVILVGHSWGGKVIRYYAIQHPEMVEALLFVDPSHEGYETVSQIAEDAGVDFFMGEGRPEVAEEYAHIIENFELLENIGSLPDVPTIVLTSTRDRNGEFETNWVNAHATLGEDLTDFTHIITEKSGHFIQIEEPKLVLEAINSLLN